MEGQRWGDGGRRPEHGSATERQGTNDATQALLLQLLAQNVVSSSSSSSSSSAPPTSATGWSAAAAAHAGFAAPSGGQPAAAQHEQFYASSQHRRLANPLLSFSVPGPASDASNNVDTTESSTVQGLVRLINQLQQQGQQQQQPAGLHLPSPWSGSTGQQVAATTGGAADQNLIRLLISRMLATTGAANLPTPVPPPPVPPSLDIGALQSLLGGTLPQQPQLPPARQTTIGEQQYTAAPPLHAFLESLQAQQQQQRQAPPFSTAGLPSAFVPTAHQQRPQSDFNSASALAAVLGLSGFAVPHQAAEQPTAPPLHSFLQSPGEGNASDALAGTATLAGSTSLAPIAGAALLTAGVLPDKQEELSPQQPGFRARKRRIYTHESFPERLYRMLVEVEQKDRDEIVSFTYDGAGLEIHQPELFLHEIIPDYFRHKSLKSFRRQLSMYGFRRIPSGPKKGAYEHKLFHKGRPELVKQMVRISELIPVDGKEEGEEGEDQGGSSGSNAS